MRADELKPMPLKEQNGNSQSSHGSGKLPKAEIKVPKAEIKLPTAQGKVPVKAQAATPQAVLAGLGAKPSAEEMLAIKDEISNARGGPLVTPQPAAGNRRAGADDDDDDGLEDVRTALMSREQLKRSLERRKKRKQAALAAAGR